jgi:phage baseplate assembly protein V
MSETAETRRQMGDLIRLAAIASVDRAARTCTVRFTADDEPLGPFDWLVGMAGDTAVWSVPSVGEQVILLSPGADVEGGVVLRGIFSSLFPAPSSDDVEMIRFKDHSIISYDPAAHHLSVALTDGATVALTASGGFSLSGDVAVEGKVHATATISSDDQVKAGEITLTGHHHMAPNGPTGGALA